MVSFNRHLASFNQSAISIFSKLENRILKNQSDFHIYNIFKNANQNRDNYFSFLT